VATQISTVYNTVKHVGVGVTLYTHAQFHFWGYRIVKLVWAQGYDRMIRVANLFSKRRSLSLLFSWYRGSFPGVKLLEPEVCICYTD